MDKKKEYLVRELWILAWNASVQHAGLYKGEATKNQKADIDKFRKEIINYVREKVIPQYKLTVTEQQHLGNLKDLIEYANTINPGILGKDRYKYGVAQKVLNLALKYYWCLGLIQEPLHCPIDSIIIGKTICKGKKWTQILTEEEYLEVISAIRSLAEQKNCSIAQWELDNFERREQREDHKPDERKDSPRWEKDREERTEQTSSQQRTARSFPGIVGKERYIVYLPHGGGGKFDACELVRHIRESGRNYIIQGQQQVSLANQTKPRSLDYWLRKFAKNPDVKQAVNSVCDALVATGLFEKVDDLECPDSNRPAKGLRLV